MTFLLFGAQVLFGVRTIVFDFELLAAAGEAGRNALERAIPATRRGAMSRGADILLLLVLVFQETRKTVARQGWRRARCPIFRFRRGRLRPPSLNECSPRGIMTPRR